MVAKFWFACEWLWMVVGGAGQIMVGPGWSWVIFQYRFTAFLTLNVSQERKNILSSKKNRYSGLDW